MENENKKPEAVEPEVIGPDAAGIVEAETDAAGIEEVVPEVVGIEEIEPEVIITETARTEAAGLGTPEAAPLQGAAEPKKKGQKKLVIALALILIAAGAGYYFYTNSDGYKYKKLVSEAEAQYKAGSYDNALEIYEQGLSAGYDEEDLLTRIKDVYYAKVLKASSEGSSMDGMLDMLDEMGSRFPELAPDAESWTAQFLGNVMKETLGNGVSPAISLYNNAVGRYFQSDLICHAVDDIFRPGLRSLLEQEIKDLADKVVEPGMLAEDYENMFAAISASGLRKDCHDAGPYVEYPIVAETSSGQRFGVHYDNNYFSLYHGEYDADGKRSGNGAHMYLRIDKDDPGRYVDEIVIGEFRDDSANGPFVQYIYSTRRLSDPRYARFEGEMKDNRYYGEVIGDVTTGYGMEESTTYKGFRYIFDDEGHPISQGTTDGKAIIALALDPENGDATFTAQESAFLKTYGMMPYYEPLL